MCVQYGKMPRCKKREGGENSGVARMSGTSGLFVCVYGVSVIGKAASPHTYNKSFSTHRVPNNTD